MKYKWLEIIESWIYKKGDKNILATYKNWKIIVHKDFYSRSILIQEQSLFHEFVHHIWYKLPKTYKVIWRLISNWKLIPILNAFWLTDCTKNAYARKYWEKNIKEDFATIWEEIEKQRIKWDKKFHNFVDFKIKVVKSLINKFQ